jgi:outer membrane protein OmpA-like peptidoglycan-associated protein
VALDRLAGALAARDAELDSVRAELEDLRERFAFDLQLAAMKSEGGPGLVATPSRADLRAAAAMVRLPASAVEEPLTEIHFDTGSAALSPGGLAHAAAAAVMLGDMPLERVRVLGFTDRTGSPERNHVLALARARAVADFLVRAGFPAELIETEGMGEKDLPVMTGDGVPEPLNRCVAIYAVPLPTG